MGEGKGVLKNNLSRHNLCAGVWNRVGKRLWVFKEAMGEGAIVVGGSRREQGGGSGDFTEWGTGEGHRGGNCN